MFITSGNHGSSFVLAFVRPYAVYRPRGWAAEAEARAQASEAVLEAAARSGGGCGLSSVEGRAAFVAYATGFPFEF